MLSTLSLRARMLAVALLGATGTIVVAAVGYIGLDRSLSATDELTQAADRTASQVERTTSSSAASNRA